jgi:hypothetical protein
MISLNEALERGLIEENSEQIIDAETGSTIFLVMAVDSSIVSDAAQLQKSEHDGITTSIILRSNGTTEAVKTSEKLTKPTLTLDEALKSGLVDARSGLVTDPMTGEKVTVEEAVKRGLIDGESTKY